MASKKHRLERSLMYAINRSSVFTLLDDTTAATATATVIIIWT